MDRKTILIVDDDPCLRQVVDFKLRSQNYDTIPVSSIREAMDTVKASLPDLIILDLAFGEEELNGFDFLRIVRDNPRTRSVPVIVLSVLSSQKNIFRSRELGADDFLGKPFSVNVLVEKIRQISAVD